MNDAAAPPHFDALGELPLAGRLSIEASAGTGKTHTLATLAVRYVAEAAIPVEQLLVVTFGRMARAELRERIRSRLAEVAAALGAPLAVESEDGLVRLLAKGAADLYRRRIDDALASFEGAMISTIHGFAQQARALLASQADLDAQLLDDAGTLVEEVVADLLAARAFAAPQEVGELPTARQLAALAGRYLGTAEVALQEGDEPKLVMVRELVGEVAAEVRRRRRRSATLSYDDLLEQLAAALEGEGPALERIRARYRVVLIDEFQDTDPLQWRIFDRLFPASAAGVATILVGDPKQAIYGFRGANVHSYLEAAAAPGTVACSLATNWRSDGALLGALGHLLEGTTFGAPAIAFTAVAPSEGRGALRLRDAAGLALPALSLRAAVGPSIARSPRGEGVRADSARLAIYADLAAHVGELLATAHLPATAGEQATRPLAPGDVAVLVRANAEAEPIARALRRRQIPAVVVQGTSVLDSPAAAQWRQLLRALELPAHAPRARRVALGWFGGMAAEELANLGEADLAALQERLANWSELLARRGFGALWSELWGTTGLAERLLGREGGERDLTDLTQIAGLVQGSLAGRPASPTLLLDELERLARRGSLENDEELFARQIESEAASVQVLTVHKSKGLEYPVVCVPTMWGAPSPGDYFQDPDLSKRVLLLDRDDASCGVPAALRRKALVAEESEGELLRLLYVALTRAEHHVALWWSKGAPREPAGLSALLNARLGALDLERLKGEPADLELLGALFADQEASEAVLVDAPTRGRRAPLPRPVASPPTLRRATMTRTPDRSHRRWSFSSMVQLVAHGDGGGDEFDPSDSSLGDAGAEDEHEPAERAASLERAPLDDELPLGSFVGGVRFGTLVHEILQRCDFASPELDAHLLDLARRELGWRDLAVDAEGLVEGLVAVLESPLGPLANGARLQDLTSGDRLNELSFELHLAEGGGAPTARAVGDLAAEFLPAESPLGRWARALATGRIEATLAGHLTGSIDLVARQRDEGAASAPGRFLVADYKTNTLAEPGRRPRPADYAQQGLAAAMLVHDYPLQALLYEVALHRYLRWRLSEYSPARHLGGVVYLFVRGMQGPSTPIDAMGNPNGIFSWLPDPELVVGLSDLLDGRPG